MKRLFLILLFWGVLYLVSCQESYDILDYQSRDIVAVCRVNEKYTVEIAKTEGFCKITVQEPKNMNGLSFEVGDRVYAIAKDTKIEMDRESLGGICALAEVFSQSEECMTSAKEEGQGSVLTFQTDKCVYKITIGENSLPQRAYIVSDSFEYNVEFTSIELK